MAIYFIDGDNSPGSRTSGMQWLTAAEAKTDQDSTIVPVHASDPAPVPSQNPQKHRILHPGALWESCPSNQCVCRPEIPYREQVAQDISV